jgi:hypothetical protein
MKIKRALLIGIAIWVIAILFYSISYYVPVLENAETQGNLVLFAVVMPLVWWGCSFYYRKEKNTHGYLVGQTLLLTAVVLDAFITVPFFIIPNGGNHYSFFTSLGFWMIALEFLLVAVLYWYINIYPNKTISKL